MGTFAAIDCKDPDTMGKVSRIVKNKGQLILSCLIRKVSYIVKL